GVDGDDVAVLDEGDRPAGRGFRSHVADAEPSRRTREAPVGDERNVLHALTIERGSGRQHLAHAGSALRTLVADDEHLAFLIGARLDGGEAGLLAVEYAGRTAVLLVLQPGHLDDGAVGGERAPRAH